MGVRLLAIYRGGREMMQSSSVNFRSKIGVIKMKRICFILLLLISSTFLIECSSKKEPIHIGVNSWPPCEIWYVAKEMGFFGKTPVNIVRFSVWTDNMLSLYSGKTDLTHATYLNALYYSGKGEKGEIILSSDTIFGGDGLAVKNYIKTGNDLKGKKIAVEIATDEHFLLLKALEQNGLLINDVVLLPSTSMEAKDKFIAGEVDACFTYEPFLSGAAAKGDGRVFSTTKDYPGYMVDVLVGRSDTLKKRPKDFKNIISAWYKAQNFIKSNPEKAFEIMSKNEEMDVKAFKEFYNYFHFYSLKENKDNFSSKEFKDKLEEINSFLYQSKLIKNKVDIKEIFNDEIVNSISGK